MPFKTEWEKRRQPIKRRKENGIMVKKSQFGMLFKEG